MNSFSSLATAAGVTNIVASTLPCGLIRVQGYFKGAADAWLQLLDAVALPANGAVPKKSYYMPSGAPFSWEFDPGEFEARAGLVVAVSDTEATLTISASKMDCFGELEPRAFTDSTFATAGDLATGVDSLQVVAEAAGPKVLYRVDYVNNDGADRYLFLYKTDAGANGSVPFMSWKATNGQTLVLDFGTQGLVPFGASKGWTLRQSSTPVVSSDGVQLGLTATASAASYMRAFYK